MAETASLIVRASALLAAISSQRLHNVPLRLSAPACAAAAAASCTAHADGPATGAATKADVDTQLQAAAHPPAAQAGAKQRPPSSGTDARSDSAAPASAAAGAEGAAAAYDAEEGGRERRLVRSVSEQVTFGGVLGFATGYTIRSVGKAVLLLVGAEVVVLQYMAYRHWVIVDWRRIARDMAPRLSRSTWEGVLDVLVYRMPFSAAFSGGLIAGLRLSTSK